MQDLRTLLVQGAQHILGPFGTDCDLRRWGLEAGRAATATQERLRQLRTRKPRVSDSLSRAKS